MQGIQTIDIFACLPAGMACQATRQLQGLQAAQMGNARWVRGCHSSCASSSDSHLHPHGKVLHSLLHDSAYYAAVHVDVDVLTPAIQTVKKSANDVWIQLPPQVRTAAPFVGVGLGSSFIVYRIQQSRLNRAVRQHLECLLLSSCIA